MRDLTPGHCLGIFPCWGVGGVVLAAEPCRRSGDWEPPASPDVTPTLSSSLPPGCCAWSSPCLSLLYGQRGAEQSDR